MTERKPRRRLAARSVIPRGFDEFIDEARPRTPHIGGGRGLAFLENTTLFRIDETVLRVEALRGGPNPVFAGGRGRLFLSFSHYGKRYANDENTIELPDYIKLDAGLQYSFSEAWSAQLNVDNLSDEVGLTEGNPRTDMNSSGIGQLYSARTLFGRSLTFAVRYSFQPG